MQITILIYFQLDIMEPKVPEDIYKSHLEPNSMFEMKNIILNLNGVFTTRS